MDSGLRRMDVVIEVDGRKHKIEGHSLNVRVRLAGAESGSSEILERISSQDDRITVAMTTTPPTGSDATTRTFST
ncbi:MAG: hypothetical protein AAF467_03880 [Actinomycetota bacterium]